ncbi:MAG: hypothetical protein EPO35_07940 [Acidobacteria bacterium]|nr:MAG: hypothetical protein EPO35_07940 [Acidobacteriota bacterium]
MGTERQIEAALRPFERRAGLVAFVRTLAPGLITAAVATEALWLLEIRSPLALIAPAAIALAISAGTALSRKPARLAIARRIDTRANLRDLVVSAVSCDGDGMAALVRDTAISELGRLSPRDTHPFELPRHWRKWIGAAVAAQLVVMPMIWQAPASRTPESGLSSLTLPPGPGTAADAERQNTPPSNSAAADPVSSTAAIAATARPITATAAPGEIGSDPSSAVAAGGNDRLRLAATAADADLAAGRVPLARRGIVQRYFAALQTQRKQDR